MERNLLYVYIPREKILNFPEPKYKKKEDYVKCFFYVKNKKFMIDDKNIQDIDIYNLKYVKKNCFYKCQYKSKNDKYFDYFFKLKPEYNDLSEVYVEKDQKKDKLRLSYKKNITKQLKKMRNYNKNKKTKELSDRDKRKLQNPFTCFFD